MSILFADARSSTRPTGRWTTGLWLSVGLHAIVAVVLIVVPIRASEKPSAPSKRSRMVFVLPATQLVKLPPAPIVAPRLPSARPAAAGARNSQSGSAKAASGSRQSSPSWSSQRRHRLCPPSNGPSKSQWSSVLLRPACSSGQMARERARPQLPSRPAGSEIKRPRRVAPQPRTLSRQVDSAAGRAHRVRPQTPARSRRRGSIYGHPHSLPWRR